MAAAHVEQERTSTPVPSGHCLPVGEPIPDALAVTPTSMASLLRLTSELLADPHAGLRLPAELIVERYDAVTLALRAARTPREVLALVARYAPLIVPLQISSYPASASAWPASSCAIRR